METKMKKIEKFSRTVTWKAIVVGIITLILLIPGAMIQSLVHERQTRSIETVNKINDLWSRSQTITGPILTIPYEIVKTYENNNEITERHYLNVTPDILKINGKLFPEERHYGIYKSILYKSDLNFEGSFPEPDFSKINYTTIKWDEATIKIGLSDLRGVSQNPDFMIDGKQINMEAGGNSKDDIGTSLMTSVNSITETDTHKKISFSCHLNLKGSSSINFVPVGKNTNVKLSGAWNAPGFTGSFIPNHTITGKDFSAEWNILHFNRNIPEQWIDNNVETLSKSAFGVNLVNVVNHYQQTERSAKYSIMFISLTFVVFFFVEIITKKRVHPIQYVLVGLALLLFYSLLLSLSEQIGFSASYSIASIAIIGMITLYANSIFKDKKQSGLLALILTILYTYLYVVIQIEDIALLIGSIGLFIILGIIMFVSSKINWYKQEIVAEENLDVNN